MRKPIDPQMKLGEVDPSQVEFDLRSRDETTKLLIGLQYIYAHDELRTAVFRVLRQIIPEDVNSEDGRPGMPLWTIFVLGTIRLSSNLDFDKLKDQADYHTKIREMIGHSLFDRSAYPLQTLKDNVSLLTPEVLDQINQIVVGAGHDFLRLKKKDGLNAKCDSFVVETNVHYPTDINLFFDATRKAIELTTTLCLSLGIGLWRQSAHNVRKIKCMLYRLQNMKRSNSRDPQRKAKKENEIRVGHREYVELCESFLDRVGESLRQLRGRGIFIEAQIYVIERFATHARKQVDLIRRRVLNGETIPHRDKVFSVFEEHTEWIQKGKAGVPQELGLRVCLMTDQYNFILNHSVMVGQTDEQVTVPITQVTKGKFPALASCSYDKGFYTPENLKDLQQMLDHVTLSKKGRLSEADKARENDEPFVVAKRQHAAVESAINAIENHGLDRCPDHALRGFKRYVALAVVSLNLHVLGHCIQAREFERLKKVRRAA